MDGIRGNGGGGLFDAAGLCRRLLVILNDMEFRGVRNAQHAYLLASGLEALRDGFEKKEKKENGEGPEEDPGEDPEEDLKEEWDEDKTEGGARNGHGPAS